MARAMAELAHLRRLLCALQAHIRDTIVAARRRHTRSLARVAAVTAADTIYEIDRLSEEAILAWFDAHWPARLPVELVMEGLDDGVTFPRGVPVGRTAWKCLLDPIDGTRGIMYDKRSAFILAGVAPQRGPRTALADICVAAMTELPPTKQDRADQLSAVRGGGVIAVRHDLARGTTRRWRPVPSRATNFEHGFASLVRFFPEGKAWIAQLEEALWQELGLLGRNGGQLVFDDQYISTGGQLYELIVGHDRMIGDVRPIAYPAVGFGRSSLCCHPYDLCTALIAQEAGCVVEAPTGGKVIAPLDTTAPVAWMGFANPALARRVRPVLQRLLRERAPERRRFR